MTRVKKLNVLSHGPLPPAEPLPELTPAERAEFEQTWAAWQAELAKPTRRQVFLSAVFVGVLMAAVGWLGWTALRPPMNLESGKPQPELIDNVHALLKQGKVGQALEVLEIHRAERVHEAMRADGIDGGSSY
jgi:hypothetical protein